MVDEDIKNIIRELVEKARVAIRNQESDNVTKPFIIMFEACYDSLTATDDDDRSTLLTNPKAQKLAMRVLALGWDGLGALPALWGEETVWHIILKPETFPEASRSACAEAATITQCLADGNTRAWEKPRMPNLDAHFEAFRRLYPDIPLLTRA